ncbi:hypothetical protein AB0J86_28055 [Micromonospora sp. NPDC049559]|uniref:hypothetical protein n=1 Tax=Micromonospora sp. NPDC049559 TaxID=3155923 RepID=UPI003423E56A
MEAVWAVFGIGAALTVVLFGYVAWRDRKRTTSADDSAAGRTSAAEADRQAAARHAAQGAVRDQDRLTGHQ